MTSSPENFTTDGLPLTHEQRELLIILAEEANEVGKLVMKILRFGFYSSDPKGELNAALLRGEVGDFLGVSQRLTELGVFDAYDLQIAAQDKQRRMEPYLVHKGNTAPSE